MGPRIREDKEGEGCSRTAPTGVRATEGVWEDGYLPPWEQRREGWVGVCTRRMGGCTPISRFHEGRL